VRACATDRASFSIRSKAAALSAAGETSTTTTLPVAAADASHLSQHGQWLYEMMET
jgi:hypothetical protein